jgi:hypothetical protein
MNKTDLDKILKYASYGIDILRWFVGAVRSFPIWKADGESSNMDIREGAPTEDNSSTGTA